MRDLWEELGGFLVGFVVLMALVVSLIYGIAACDNHSVHVTCLRLHENTGLETKVARSGLDTECYIKTPGGDWVPSEKYRGVTE